MGLKTFMPPAKPNRICLYHFKHPKGKIFNVDEAQANYQEMVEAGWVDAPGKLELPGKESTNKAGDVIDHPLFVDLSVVGDAELAREVDSRGTVLIIATALMNLDQVVELANHFGIVVNSESRDDSEPLINRFFESPTSLSKEELVELGAEYDLALRMNMLPENMIERITEVLPKTEVGG